MLMTHRTFITGVMRMPDGTVSVRLMRMSTVVDDACMPRHGNGMNLDSQPRQHRDHSRTGHEAAPPGQRLANPEHASRIATSPPVEKHGAMGMDCR